MIDVEESKLSIHELLRRCECLVIVAETVNVLLHHEHPDEACESKQREQGYTKAYGAEENQDSRKYGFLVRGRAQ